VAAEGGRAKGAEFRGDARFGTWIFSIARNRCFNAIKKRSELLSADGVIESVDVAAGGALAELRAAEREALVHAAAASVLDAQEQEAVHLRYIEGLPLEQITDLMGLEGTGARAVLQRCRRKLGAELRRRLEEMGHGTSFIRTDT